jgi:hypothetical protein
MDFSFTAVFISQLILANEARHSFIFHKVNQQKFGYDPSMAESFNFNTWWDTVSIKDAAANAQAKAWFVDHFVTNFDVLVELEFQHFPLDFPVGCK